MSAIHRTPCPNCKPWVPVRSTRELLATLSHCIPCPFRRGTSRNQVVCGHAQCGCGGDTPWVEVAETLVSKSLWRKMEAGGRCPAGRW